VSIQKDSFLYLVVVGEHRAGYMIIDKASARNEVLMKTWRKSLSQPDAKPVTDKLNQASSENRFRGVRIVDDALVSGGQSFD